MKYFSIIFLAILFFNSCTPTVSKPNIIWIFSDDHSYQTIGAYGGRLQGLNPTPNLDMLAAEGKRFNKCYVENSICAPSRAALLTGKMSHMNGKYTNTKRHPFNHDQQQFQKILQQNGYETAMIGKIHLDGSMQGFDYWEVLPGQGKYYNPEFITEEGQTNYKGRYVTEVITERALNWLKNGWSGQKPFMLMVHHKAPHRNWDPATQHMQKYEDVEIPEPNNLFDDYATKGTAVKEQELDIANSMNLNRDLKAEGEMYANDPRFKSRYEWMADNKPEGNELIKWKYQTYMKDYLRCIWSVDESIGEIMQALKDLDLDENTIVCYSSDQGFYMGEHGWFDKRMMYEESFRTPLLVKWPGTVQPGSVNNDLVQNIDFAETFLDIAGAPIPEDMQGKSIVPLLKGETPADWRQSLYYHYYEYPGAHAVRRHEGVANKEYKLIRFYGEDVPNGEEWEFFDLKNDPSEMTNIYSESGAQNKIAEMKEELASLRGKYQVKE
ncbi:sulfatase [uncultured Draconibacterium sp.]|uniref:sulfatase family protein n=1 Tax=uncultured Draconibacterium sp. TaxID=1573823 RepID=UPI0025E0B850|nr:sulfatase [uncultured Draconibacterium sp.]